MLMDPLLARECQQTVPSSFLGFEDVVQIDHSWDGPGALPPTTGSSEQIRSLTPQAFDARGLSGT